MTHADKSQLHVLTIVGICIMIIALTIAYGAMIIPLSITGNVNSVRDRWNVYFDDVRISSVGSTKYNKPRMQGTTLNNFHIVFSQDTKVIYRFKIVNDSSYDAVLGDIIYNKPTCVSNNNIELNDLCNNIKYKLTYNDGIKVNKNDVIAKDSFAEVKLVIEYPINSVKYNNVSVDDLGVMLMYNKKYK